MQAPKVLLIWDNTDHLERIRHYLTQQTCLPQDVFVHAGSSETACHVAAMADVILMPLAFYAQSYRQDVTWAHPELAYRPVIVISGKEDEEKALTAVAAGAADYIITEEMTAEVLHKTIHCAIARSGANYKQLFDESPAPMFIYDRETYRFLATNEACRKQYGYSKDEFLQMTAEQIRPAEEVALFQDANTISPEEYHDYGRWKHRKKNGDVFTVNIFAHDTQFAGKAARLVTAVDISHAVTAEQQLSDKNKEVGNILESITDGFFALNPDGEFTYLNKECEKIFGLTREKAIGRKIWDIHNRDEYPDFYTHYQQAAEKRIPARFEGHVGATGRWLSVTAYPTKNGLAVYLIDITERKRIRQQLYNDGQQLRAIINNTSDIIWLLNRDRKIIVGNDAFRRWMEGATGKEDMDTLPAAIGSGWEEHFEKAFGGQSLTFTAMETKGSALFYREICLYPVQNEMSDVVSISCFARDVTQQQQRIQRIQLQNQYLEKIAWMHSHDARGPVANILGLASLFEMNDPSDPDNRMMMELIIESSHQLDKVIRKIVADIDTYQLNYGDEE